MTIAESAGTPAQPPAAPVAHGSSLPLCMTSASVWLAPQATWDARRGSRLSHDQDTLMKVGVQHVPV
jgi:hypothetical protein